MEAEFEDINPGSELGYGRKCLWAFETSSGLVAVADGHLRSKRRIL